MKLTVNGIEVEYDPTKLLNIVLDTGPDYVEVGPIRLAIQGGPCTVRANNEQDYALVLQNENPGQFPFTLDRQYSPYDGQRHELLLTGNPEPGFILGPKFDSVTGASVDSLDPDTCTIVDRS